jgi:hypothetical protein
MQNPLSPFAQGLAPGVQQPVYTRPVKTAAPIQAQAGSKKGYNPFFAAMNPDSEEYKSSYGINRPLAQPMFLGYRDDEPMYGGTKLFLLY